MWDWYGYAYCIAFTNTIAQNSSFPLFFKFTPNFTNASLFVLAEHDFFISGSAAEVKSASDEKPSVEIPASLTGTKQLLQVDV